jgi:hypothetical protein
MFIGIAIRLSSSKAGPPPTPTVPSFSTAPSINGTPQVGIASSYASGNYTGYPAPVITQQWTLNGVDIGGATGSTYTPITADEADALRVRQIITNSEGSDNETSVAKNVNNIPTVAAPTIIGTPEDGVATAYTPGSATGYPVPTRTQTWYVDAVSVGTGATYTPSVGDVGGTLTVTQTETNVVGGDSETSAGVIIVASGGGGFGFTTDDWVAPTGATSQRIYLSTTSDGQSAVGVLTNSATQQYRDLAAGATNAVVSGLPSSGVWYYKMTASNAGGESDQSQEFEGTAA